MKSTRLPSWIERGLGFEPLPAPPHVLSLDRERLIYARFLTEPAGPRLLERLSLEVPPQMFESHPLGGSLSDREGFELLVSELADRASTSVDRAALVLPDEWLRLIFVDSEALPVAEQPRLEVIRWKMKRLLPFEVDELRIDAQEIDSLPAGGEASRLVVGFAREPLLAGLEAAFEGSGIEVGRITNRSSGLLLALTPQLDELRLGVVVLVEDSHYTLVATRRGVPVLYRHKSLEPETAEFSRQSGVLRDLRLTRGFLAERLPEDTIDGVELVSTPADRSHWQEWLSEGLGRSARFHEFDSGLDGESGSSSLTGAMFGVVQQEIR